MADDPVAELLFDSICPDCGRRQIKLPNVLPDVGDALDWDQRDYDGFRLFMLQELAACFPERRRWTPADVEVALVEVLAFALDQLSDALDRVAAESFLETARRPESLRRLLLMIGHDVVGKAKRLRSGPFAKLPDDKAKEACTSEDRTKFDRWWLDYPEQMEQARIDGPRTIHDQHRMVTLKDYERRLEEHPLVLRAHAWEHWNGSWNTIHVAVIASWRNDEEKNPKISSIGYLDSIPNKLDEDSDIWKEVLAFHAERDLPLPNRAYASIRSVLHAYIEDYRMIGQEVELAEAEEVGIAMTLSIYVNSQYFHTEIRHAVDKALGTGPGGFFELGRLQFGEDLWASDIYQALMSLSGIDNVCLSRFKRLDGRFSDETSSGRIILKGLEVAVCDNDQSRPERGYYRLNLHGGRKG